MEESSELFPNRNVNNWFSAVKGRLICAQTMSDLLELLVYFRCHGRFILSFWNGMRDTRRSGGGSEQKLFSNDFFWSDSSSQNCFQAKLFLEIHTDPLNWCQSRIVEICFFSLNLWRRWFFNIVSILISYKNILSLIFKVVWKVFFSKVSS